ncbi:MAG: surfeit locus 1 family protein [Rhodospirillaceae bacterium]|jgi:surfeit locus 1 family protein|nr:surfeit locus 1 family protein [Rhodospirillaceae bacterium]
MKFRPTFWPTVFTVPAVLLMLGLGVWQLERLQWKQALIAERTERVGAPAIPLPDRNTDASKLEYHHVVIAGAFQHDKEMLLGARSLNSNPGYHVVTPFSLDDGQVLLVDRGWIPLDRKTPDKRAAGEIPGRVHLDAVIRRKGTQNWMVPDNRPDLNFFFWMDLPTMARLAGLPSVETRFYLEAGPAENPGGFPIGGQTRITLPNDHLQYAITWFSLAGALIVIYVLYHRGLARDEKAGGRKAGPSEASR